MNIAVIGGSGFIGSRLVQALIEQGHKVIIIDKVKSARFPEMSVQADIRNGRALLKALKDGDIEIIYNLAAEHRDDVRPASLYHDVNVAGAENICKAAEACAVSRIVFTSSTAVYGLQDGNGLPVDESRAPYPFNDYGHSKLRAEDIFKTWRQQGTGRMLTIVRPAAVFGPGHHGNVRAMIDHISRKRFVMIGSGENRKSLAYVDNLVDFLVFALTEKTGVAVYNYTDEPAFTMNELADTIGTAVHGKTYKFFRIPCRIGVMAGWLFEAMHFFTGKNYPLNRARAHKFCATTLYSPGKALSTGFVPRHELRKSMAVTVESDLSTEMP